MQELGPGQYPMQNSLSERGHYYSTKFEDSKCPKIGR